MSNDENSKRLVIYHRADFDGLFCREIARHFLDLKEEELLGWDYGDPVPEVSPETRLWMLDISVEGLMGHPNLVWIDHHKSAMEKYLAAIPGYRIDGVAACRLAWQWFALQERKITSLVWPLPDKKQFTDREVEEPLAVRLAGEYDIWDKRDPDAELFQHGLKSLEMTHDDWQVLLQEDDNGREAVYALLKSGESVRYASQQQNEAIIKRAGFTLHWEGRTFLACNAVLGNRFLFTAGLKPEHEGCLMFGWDGKGWRFSLYHAPGHEALDLSVIAVKHGGGGHRGACGFKLAELPFQLEGRAA